LTLDGVDVMLEELCKSNRQWITGELELPFGRGVNFEWEVSDIDNYYRNIVKLAPASIYLPIESKRYACGAQVVTQKQFIVQVPDGYLFRFCQEVESRCT